jgi:Flp pilus assembly protein TadG
MTINSPPTTGQIQPPRKQSGVAAVEFALVIVLLLIIVAGVIEFGRAFWYYDALTKATRDGARLLSEVPAESIGSSVTAAEDLVIDAANASNVPGFDRSHVDVTCDGATCTNDTAPANVRVAITGYEVTIGGWIPVFLPTGGATSFTRELAPATTMRYMK